MSIWCKYKINVIILLDKRVKLSKSYICQKFVYINSIINIYYEINIYSNINTSTCDLFSSIKITL